MVSIVGRLNLALIFIQLGTIAAAEFKCDQDGLYGNPENCLKFIICAHGQRQDFDCPQGTSWHADRGICDTTDLSKCTATGTGDSAGGSEDIFQQHLLSLLADFKPCHAGETTLATGTTVGGTSPNPGQGGNGTATPPSGTTAPGENNGSPATTPGTAPPGGSSPIPGGTSPNPGQGGNGSTTPNSDGPTSDNPGNNSGSTNIGPITSPQPPPTCPACPIPSEKPCPPAATCPACPTQAPKACPVSSTCPPSASQPTCPTCPMAAACPTLPTCPPAPKCAACPAVTDKACPTVVPCPTPPKKPICDDGWKYLNVTNSCYFLGVKDVTKLDAKSECIKKDSTLASIHSDDENAFIYNMAAVASSAKMFNPWIGLYRVGPGVNDFANYDGTPVDYTRFGVNQVNNIDGNEFCTEMRVRYTGTTKSLETRWNDFDCAQTRPVFVCKKPTNI